MKILFLNLEYPPIGQGAAAHHQQLIKALVENYGVTGTLITSSQDQDRIEECAPGVTAVKLDVHKKEAHYWTAPEIFRYMVRAENYLRQLLKKEQFDLCHCFFGFPCGFLAYRWRKKLPYILFLVGVDVPGPGTRLSKLQPMMMPFYRRVWGRAGALVANSEDLRQLALKAFPQMDIKTIYNGVDTKSFTPSATMPSGQELLTVARLIPLKNIHLMIEAVDKLRLKYPQIHFNIVGEGPERQHLEELVQRLKLENNVTFAGYHQRAEMPEIYQKANCFLLLSEREGMSNGLLEAMAGGLPVLVSDVGGARQLVHENGRILTEVTVDNIAAALEDFYQDPAGLAAMGAASRAAAEELSSAKAAQKVMDLSRAILSRH